MVRRSNDHRVLLDSASLRRIAISSRHSLVVRASRDAFFLDLAISRELAERVFQAMYFSTATTNVTAHMEAREEDEGSGSIYRD